jgi:hypothetical protein
MTSGFANKHTKIRSVAVDLSPRHMPDILGYYKSGLDIIVAISECKPDFGDRQNDA